MYTYEVMKPYEIPHAVTLDEILAVIEMYKKAAKNALDAGFDGVNGYFLDQFLREMILMIVILKRHLVIPLKP